MVKFVHGGQHNQEKYKCKECNGQFNNETNLSEHRLEKHQQHQLYSCAFCECKTTVLTESKIHKDTEHLSIQVNVSNLKEGRLARKKWSDVMNATMNVDLIFNLKSRAGMQDPNK